ncbi:hypothetical protein EYF80_018669 [Liparis tanakae]|uniref:Uncharacterized protein n=1 Tax=Liparis tanakae TaxID=230148 RepID=A0A4Z2HZ70_9TELE|nr:hypothetical protein EYF80_018669 [Liparis tanakae]
MPSASASREAVMRSSPTARICMHDALCKSNAAGERQQIWLQRFDFCAHYWECLLARQKEREEEEEEEEEEEGEEGEEEES